MNQAEHDRRVSELLEANNREVERRRAAEGREAAMREIIRGFLACPEIADCAPEDKDPETDDIERRARAYLSALEDAPSGSL